MPNQDNEWFDRLYIENYPRMVKQATYLLKDQRIAEELVNEAFLIYLYKKDSLNDHPNIKGWLSQTLKNLIYDELKSARHRLDLPLIGELDCRKDVFQPSLLEILPQGLTEQEKEILILYFEKQLSYEQIASYLNISIMNCRTRLFRAKKRCEKLMKKTF